MRAGAEEACSGVARRQPVNTRSSNRDPEETRAPLPIRSTGAGGPRPEPHPNPAGIPPAASRTLPHPPQLTNVPPRNRHRQGNSAIQKLVEQTLRGSGQLGVFCLAISQSIAIPRLSDSVPSRTTQAIPGNQGGIPRPWYTTRSPNGIPAHPSTTAQTRRRVQILLAGGPPTRQNPSRSVKVADSVSDKSYITGLSASEKALDQPETCCPDSVLDRSHRSGYLTTGCPPTKQRSPRRPGSPRSAGNGAEQRVPGRLRAVVDPSAGAGGVPRSRRFTQSGVLPTASEALPHKTQNRPHRSKILTRVAAPGLTLMRTGAERTTRLSPFRAGAAAGQGLLEGKSCVLPGQRRATRFSASCPTGGMSWADGGCLAGQAVQKVAKAERTTAPQDPGRGSRGSVGVIPDRGVAIYWRPSHADVSAVGTDVWRGHPTT